MIEKFTTARGETVYLKTREEPEKPPLDIPRELDVHQLIADARRYRFLKSKWNEPSVRPGDSKIVLLTEFIPQDKLDEAIDELMEERR